MSHRPGTLGIRARTLGVLAVATALGSCIDTPVATFTPAEPPASVITSPTALLLPVGSFERLAAIALDAQQRATLSAITWASADANIATVESTGLVTAIAKGTTTITATAGTVSATARVTVQEISGTLTFNRMGYYTDEDFSEVLSYSTTDRTVRSVPRDSRVVGIASAAWSPDGLHLALDGISGPKVYDFDADALYYPSDIYVADGVDLAAPWRALTTGGVSRSPSWSPDGRRMAYVEGLPPHRSHIVLKDVEGGASVRLTSVEGTYDTPRWSPDGTRLAFVQVGSVYVVNADGSGLTRLPGNGAWEWDPSWSPDGSHLAWMRSDAFGSRLLVAPVSDLGKPRVAFTGPGGAWASDPVWSPDGQWIALSLIGVNHRGIYVVSVDHPTQPVRLVQSPSNEYLDMPSTWKR